MDVGQDVLEELRTKHGQVWVLRALDEHVVVRRPTRAEYKRFRALASDEDRRADAPEALLRNCVVWPDPTALEALLERYPAMGDTFAVELLKIAGSTKDTSSTKL